MLIEFVFPPSITLLTGISIYKKKKLRNTQNSINSSLLILVLHIRYITVVHHVKVKVKINVLHAIGDRVGMYSKSCTHLQPRR